MNFYYNPKVYEITSKVPALKCSSIITWESANQLSHFIDPHEQITRELRKQILSEVFDSKVKPTIEADTVKGPEGIQYTMCVYALSYTELLSLIDNAFHAGFREAKNNFTANSWITK